MSVARVALGWAAAKDGDLAEAEPQYRPAIRDGDDYAYNNLAQLLIEDGRLGEVRKVCT